MKSRLSNIGLVFASLLFVVIFVFVVDWGVGKAVPDPRLAAGLLFTPNARATYDTYEFTFTAEINALGFRDADAGVRKERAVRIVAIGDSFTYGWGVDLEDAWIKQLEGNLRARGHDVEILNLSAPGFGPHEYARTAEEVIPLLRPDVVLVGLLQTDDLRQAEQARAPEGESVEPGSLSGMTRRLFPNLTALALREGTLIAKSLEKRNEALWNSIDIRKNWKTKNLEFMGLATPEQVARFELLDPEVQEAYREGRINPILHPRFLMRNTEFPAFELDVQSERMQARIADAGAAMERIKTVADEHGARVIGLSVPWSLRTSREVWEMLRKLGRPSHEEELTTTVPDEAARAVFDGVGVECLVVTGDFREIEAESLLFYRIDTHFNEEGNRVYAELLTPLVEAEIFGE